MAMNIKPTRFVGLHAHSTVGSIGDAIGLPQEHIDYALSNNMDGLALTDHGSMAGISHQQLHLKKLESKGVKFKAIPGVEAYFIDSLSDWSKLVQVQKANKQLQTTMASIGNELADAEADMDAKHGKEVSEDEAGGTVVELESETKRENKFDDPIKQRNHLVLLPKNNTGLKSIFQMVSESYIDGFYRYPRIDFDILKRHAKGNIIASSACVSGEALVETNVGLISLREAVERCNRGEELFILAYSEKEDRLVFEKIVWGKKTRSSAQVVKIICQNGKTLRMTPDHKVLTNKGWMRADELNANMPVSILSSDT